LLDTVVGTALMLVIFIGITGAFQLSVDVVSNNKARSGAIALAGERMEYVRSLAYGSIGTSGGIPAGNIAQSEIVPLNAVTYTRRTVVEFADDPKDGLGAADTNGITSDYKTVKVDVAWTSRTGTRHITLVSRFEPPSGMEIACTPPCGTLIISSVDSASATLPNASALIVNASTSPAIHINTFTNGSGTATLIGAPAASGYAIIVTKPGYSSAQTYDVTAQNTNPNPGHLTVADGQTTIGTFAVDVLGTKTVRTWTQILSGTWSDTFANESKIATSTNVEVSGGSAALSETEGSYASSGELQSTVITHTSLYRWKTFEANHTQPAATEIRYRFYNSAGTSLIPDSMLPGNAAGFATSSVDLSTVSTTTYSSIRVGTSFTSGDASTTPSIDSYAIEYEYGPDPLPNIAFTMQGEKTIGSGASGPIFKYLQNHNSGASASLGISNLEWDVYTVSVNGAATGYDVASSCPGPQPETFVAGEVATTNLYLTAHTANSLLVNVRSAGSGALIPDATVALVLSPSYAATSTTDSCGQAFFKGLSISPDYVVTVSATSYQTATSSANVDGTSQASVSLN